MGYCILCLFGIFAKILTCTFDEQKSTYSIVYNDTI